MSSRRLLSAAVAAVALLGGCKSFIIDQTVPTIAEVGKVGFRQTDLDFMGAALPPSLLQLEGFREISPENTLLLKLIAESTCGYAMGWVEDKNPQLASMYYLRGKDYALQALYLESSDYRHAIDAGEPVRDAVKKVSDPDLVPLLFQAGNCWAGWLNLNMTSTKVYFAQPDVLALMQRVVDLNGDFFYGGAYLFFGAYYSSIPAIAGGGLDKGRKFFDKAFAASNNQMLLVHYHFARTYAAMLKELEDPTTGKTGMQLFDEMMAVIRDTPANINPELGLANAMAKDKAARLLARRAELF